MALRIWLPLNGNLDTIGLDNNTWDESSSIVSVDNNGKIGKCYLSSGMGGQGIRYTGDINTFLTNYVDNHSWTICLWVKPTYSNTSSMNAWAFNYGMYLTIGSSNCAAAFSNYVHSKSLSFGTGASGDIWSHLVVSYDVDKNTFYAYKNGSLVNSVAWYDGETYSHYWSNYLGIGWNPNNNNNYQYFMQGRVNDFRFYDECLSAAQIKEISKGLILHYKFDDPYIENTTNILGSNGYNFSDWSSYGFGQSGVRGDVTSSISPAISGKTISVTRNTNLTTSGQTELATGFNDARSSITQNTYLTFSIYVKGSSSTIGKSGILHLYLTNGTNTASNTIRQFTFTSNWQRVSGSFKWTYSGTVTNTSVYVVGNSMSPGDVYYISNAQVEFKDYATPWTESTRTTTTIEDCSGYGYDGTIIGSLGTYPDSPRYDRYTYNWGANNWVERDCPSAEVQTVTFWLWTNTSSTEVAFVDASSKMAFGFYSGDIIIVSTDSTGPKTLYSTSLIPLSTWNHIALVKKTSVIELYVNGVKQTAASGSNYWSINQTNLTISKRGGTYSAYNLHGSLSDFRMYTTALSENDIKELYKTSAKIDDKGNLLTYELVEEE